MTGRIFLLPKPPRGVLALLVAAAASLTTVTVVDRCTTTHTTTIRTQLPARAVARNCEAPTVVRVIVT